MTIDWRYELRMLGGLAGRERAQRRREYAWRALQRLAPVVLAEGEGGRFLVRTADEAIGRALFVHGQFDLAQMDRAVAILRRELGAAVTGRTFLDLGANIGTTTVAALRRHGFPRAVAFEPEPRNLELLAHNLLLNGVRGRVQVHACAASAAAGVATLMTAPDNGGDNRVVLGAGGPVRLVALDAALDPAQEYLLWADVQGHEGHVLLGAEALLSRGTPAVMEFWPELLRLAGTLDTLAVTVARHYERIVDLGQPHEHAEPRELVSAELPALARELSDGVAHDLVLLPR
jgi:FkbM family methyltransferase